MLSQCRLAVALVTLAVGCGRVGVHLLPELSDAGPYSAAMDASAPLDAASGATDASSMSDAMSTPAVDATVPRDATVPPVMDASPSTDAQVEAGVDASKPASCSGQRLFDLCWYLAAADTSCKDACAAHGGFDKAANAHVGTTEEGGSVSDCKTILSALSGPRDVVVAKRSDGNGLGCHVWSDGTYYWLDDPSAHFDPNAVTPSGTQVRITCACLR